MIRKNIKNEFLEEQKAALRRQQPTPDRDLPGSPDDIVSNSSDNDFLSHRETENLCRILMISLVLSMILMNFKCPK